MFLWKSFSCETDCDCETVTSGKRVIFPKLSPPNIITIYDNIFTCFVRCPYESEYKTFVKPLFPNWSHKKIHSLVIFESFIISAAYSPILLFRWHALNSPSHTQKWTVLKQFNAKKITKVLTVSRPVPMFSWNDRRSYNSYLSLSWEPAGGATCYQRCHGGPDMALLIKMRTRFTEVLLLSYPSG